MLSVIFEDLSLSCGRLADDGFGGAPSRSTSLKDTAGTDGEGAGGGSDMSSKSGAGAALAFAMGFS